MDLQKILKSNYMKIRPVGAELFHTDGRTDMTKLIVAFRNFTNEPKRITSNLHKDYVHNNGHFT